MKAALFALALVALLGVGLCMVSIGLAARRLPDLPFSVRINPINILAHQDLWTAEIRSLHRVGVRCGFVFLGCVLLLGVVALLSS